MNVNERLKPIMNGHERFKTFMNGQKTYFRTKVVV